MAPRREDRLQPLCALWSRSALPAARAALASGDRSIMAVVRQLRVRTLEEAEWRLRAPGSDPLLNVNTDADLARATLLLAGEERSGTAGGKS